MPGGQAPEVKVCKAPLRTVNETPACAFVRSSVNLQSRMQRNPDTPPAMQCLALEIEPAAAHCATILPLVWSRPSRAAAVRASVMPEAANTAAHATEPAVDPQRRARDERLAQLLQRSAAGDAQSFEAFYDASVVHARTLARRILRDAELDDVLAEAFFQAWRDAGRFDAARGSAMAWLLTIVRTRALDLLRQRQVRGASGPTPDGEPADVMSDEAGPPDLLAQAQAGTRLQAALGQLSHQERWLLGLAYYRDHTHVQIAAATALPLGTVKSVLLRAQHKLRALLSAPGRPKPTDPPRGDARATGKGADSEDARQGAGPTP
jgi:RNA polymerase sigma-70 factor (ECF subfamily)